MKHLFACLAVGVAILLSATFQIWAQPRTSQTIQRNFLAPEALAPEALQKELQNMTLTGCTILKRGISFSSESSTGGAIVFAETVNVSDDTPFQMCGITLRLEGAAPENVRVFVRPRLQEHPLSGKAWIPLPFDDHADNDDNPNADLTGSIILHTHPAVLEAKLRQIEVKIEIVRTALRSNPLLQYYQCYLYSPGHTPPVTNTNTDTEYPSKNALGISIAGSNDTKNGVLLQGSSFLRPAFMTRTAWGCPWGQTSGPNMLTPTAPTHLIVHHSFSPGNDVTDWAAAVRGIWAFHVNSNGWSDIGYNWLIDPSGRIYQGRAWVDSNDNAQGAHFCGYNAQTMGVCMLGDFNSISPSEAALRSLVRLLAYRASANTLDPRGVSFHQSSSRNLNSISGHRDGCSTDCPGNALYPQLPTLRNRVFALLNPPSIERTTVNVLNQQSVEISAFVRPNGSATDVFVEWDNAQAVPPGLRHRRLIRRFTAQEAANSTTTTLDSLNPNGSYVYRIIAQNSDTLAQTLESTFNLMRTGIADQEANTTLHIMPNPAIEVPRIAYTLASAAFVRLSIKDIRGAVVLALVEAQEQAGEHNITLNTEKMSEGMYYCYFAALNNSNSRIIVRPFIILR